MADIKNPAMVQADIVNWLIGPARQKASPEEIVAGLSERLVDAGVPLLRVRIGQRVANPLISAWGVIWTRDGGPEAYTVPRGMLATGSYKGSPFEHVISTRTSFHHSLEHLVAGVDHPVLFELGGGRQHRLPRDADRIWRRLGAGGAFTTDRPGGLTTGR